MNSQPTTLSVAGPVVVAIDDSNTSLAALAWAAAYARNTHTELRAVHVLGHDLGESITWAAPGLLGAPPIAMSAGAVTTDKRRLKELFNATAPESGWSLRFLDGPAGHAIVDAAHDAQLLVVGTREHRGLERLLVGSVSHYCLAHASCPIVAVPSPTSKGRTHQDAVSLPVSALS